MPGFQGDHHIVKRSFGRGRYPLPKRHAAVDSQQRRVPMRIPRKTLFEAATVRRNGELDPATGVITAAEQPHGWACESSSSRLGVSLDREKQPRKRTAGKTADTRAKRSHKRGADQPMTLAVGSDCRAYRSAWLTRVPSGCRPVRRTYAVTAFGL
jgi:hypothetical protein